MASKRGVVAKTATEALKVLWEDGFFRGWKDKAAIDAALSKKGNHFSVPELGMALKRAKHLTRDGKRHSYKYIQKFPYVEEEVIQKKAKKN
jgi:hypothetical protein